MKSTLNSELLASMIKTKRGTKGLRDTATEIGDISAATLSRVEQGNLPDVETFIRLCKWLGVSTDTFVTASINQEIKVTEREKLLFQLRSSKELDKDTISAMVTMIDLAFTKKKRNA